MRVRIKAPDAQGLRVIEEIPDLELCRIEGRNGVGKTLAARLLELASGLQPFAALPHAWESLKDQLGTVEIEIDQLPEAHTLTFKFDPVQWADRSMEDCARDPGEALMDGIPCTWDQARERLQVRRIAGDEGLPETLGRTLRERAVDAEAVQAYIRPFIERWSTDLSLMGELTDGISEQTISTTWRTIVKERASLHALSSRRSSLESTCAKAEVSLEQLRQAEVFQREGIVSLEGYAQYRSKYDELRIAVSRLEDDLTRSSGEVVADRARREAINSWLRLREYRQRALTKAALRERQVLSALELAERPSPAAVFSLRADLEKMIAELEYEAQLADATGSVRQLASRLESPLENVPADILQYPVATLDREVTGEQLLVGLRRRRQELEDVPSPGPAHALRAEKLRKERRLQSVRILPDLISATDRKRSLLDEAEREVASLMNLPAGSIAAREKLLERLSQTRGELVRVSFEAIKSLNALYGVLGMDPSLSAELVAAEQDDSYDGEDEEEETLSDAALDGAIDQVLIPVDDVFKLVNDWQTRLGSKLLDGSLNLEPSGDLNMPVQLLVIDADAATEFARSKDEAGRELSDVLGAIASAIEVHDTALTILEAARLRMRSSITVLIDADGPWARFLPGIEKAFELAGMSLGQARALAERSHTLSANNEPDMDELRASEALRTISDIAGAIEEAGGQLVDSWGTVSGYLNAQAARLAPRLAVKRAPSPESFEIQLTEPILRNWAEGQLSALLSSAELRQELFDQANTVDMDLSSAAVMWRTSDGKRRRRPLEAFSSGEQVFAYTRAKLDQLRPLKPGPVVVVFLDEFGAFVARDRFGQLMSYVEHTALGRIADQVIVMLPLTTSEAENLGVSGAGESPNAQLARRGYFAVSGRAGR